MTTREIKKWEKKADQLQAERNAAEGDEELVAVVEAKMAAHYEARWGKTEW